MKLTNTEINQIAAAAQADRQQGMEWYESESMATLFVALRDDIDRAAGEIVGRVNESAENKFIERAEQMITYSLDKWNAADGSFKSYAKRNIERAKRSFLKDRSSYASMTDSFDLITAEGVEEDKPATVFIEDKTQDTEQTIIDKEFMATVIEKYGKNEKAAYIIELMLEPTKKKHIDIARELAAAFGMTENAAVQAVKRLRADLKKGFALA
jgi:hypothetical protein